MWFFWKKTFACLLVSIFHNLVTQCAVYKMHTNINTYKIVSIRKKRHKHANLEENHFQKYRKYYYKIVLIERNHDAFIFFNSFQTDLKNNQKKSMVSKTNKK